MESHIPDNPETPETPNIPNHLDFSPPTKFKHGHKLIYGCILLLIIIALAGALWYVRQTNSKTKRQPVASKTVTAKSAQASHAAPTPVLTYVSTGSPQTFIVTNVQNKVLAKTNMPSGDNTFGVMAKNSQALLLTAVHDANAWDYPGTDPHYRLVNYDGSVTTLSPSVSAIITQSFAQYSNSQFLLNGDDVLLYANCNQSSNVCSLDSLNLLSGASNSYVSATGNGTVDGTKSSILLMGVNGNTVYYDYNYESKINTIVAYSLQSRHILKSFPTQSDSLNAPTISNDYSKAVYTDANDDGTRYIMNLTNGDITTYKSSVSLDTYDYLWSPNDDYIAFTAPIAGGSGVPGQTPPPATIDYIDVATGQTKTITTLGNSSYNEATLYAWTSSSDLYYSNSQTTQADDFPAPTSYNEIEVPPGTILPNPAPNGYTFLYSP